MGKGKAKVCLVSSSGGHWEQLQKLKPLVDKYGGFMVTEKTPFVKGCPYLMMQTDLKDKFMPAKMLETASTPVRSGQRSGPTSL